MVNKPLIRPYFWGGYVRGGRLTSHEDHRKPRRSLLHQGAVLDLARPVFSSGRENLSARIMDVCPQKGSKITTLHPTNSTTKI